MDTLKVSDLMVPIDQFPVISGSASLYEALFALEKAQEDFLTGASRQRILMVADDAGRVIGKISPIDLFIGLEKNYTKINFEEVINNHGLSYVFSAMRKDYGLWKNPFSDLCRTAGDVFVRNFVNKPAPEQSLRPDDRISRCFHIFVTNRNDAIFVLRDTEPVGMLRFSDVYRKVSETMKACGF